MEVKDVPGFDRTGPAGRGAMTGRGLGYCNPRRASQATEETSSEPAEIQSDVAAPDRGIVYGLGRGGLPRGGGRGFGRGRGRMMRRF